MVTHTTVDYVLCAIWLLNTNILEGTYIIVTYNIKSYARITEGASH